VEVIIHSRRFIVGKANIYEKEIVSANILRVAAGTTGFRGGDSGHGGRTHIEIEDLANTDVQFIVEKNGRQLRIELGGDTELETIIEALEFVSETLEHEAYKDAFEAWGRKPYRQTRKLAIELFDKAWGCRAVVMVKDFRSHLLSIYRRYNIEMSTGWINRVSSFDPTYEDLHAIIQGIAACEAEKHADRADPKKMLRDFLLDAVDEPDFGELAQKHRIKTGD
jgi:hypothetical protein